MADSYNVPAAPVRTELIVKRSRFLTTAQRATSVDHARELIAAVRVEMLGANHHVYAFRIGYGNSVIEGMSDDGEPTGTSGPPTLAVVRGSGIGDIVLVTTRFFGGTKLGTGGLVRAYTESAQEAIQQLETELKMQWRTVGLELPYSLYNATRRLILEYNGKIDDEAFEETIMIIVRFVEKDLETFVPQLRDRTSGLVSPIILD